MRLLLLLRCVLVAACASIASGITETELEQVTEPAVIIASHAYRGYVVDDAFEAAVRGHLVPASLLLVGLDCPASPTPSELCQRLTADHALLLNLDPTPRGIPLPQTTSPAVFAAGLIQSAYPHLVREFPSARELRAGLDRGASLLLAYLPPSHAASKATLLNVAKQFEELRLKLALITDLSVVRGVVPVVPAHAEEQVLVWYTAVVGGTRGWKLARYPAGLNEEFTGFVHKCTYPAHVHYRGKESHSVFKGSGLPQAFVLLDSAHQHVTVQLVQRLAAELLGDYVMMTINIETHPEMLEYFHGANLDSLPDFFVRPTPGELVTLSPDIPRNVHALASALRNIVRDSSTPSSPEEEGVGGDVQSLSVEQFSGFVLEHQQPAVAALCVEGHPQCSQLREAIHDLASSVPQEVADVAIVLVQVDGGMTGLAPLSRTGVVLTSLPMLLVHDEREWHQFERDLSFTGIVGFVQKTLKWSEATISTIFSNHAILLDALGADQLEESLYPPQLREDDEVGVFVHDHKITAKLFQRFDRDPNQLRECIAANPQSVVAFYQPWSVRSRAFLPHLPKIEALAEGGGVRVSVCAVNCQDYPDLCEQHKVTAYPTVLLHRGDGQWEVHSGVLGAPQILESLVDRKLPTVEEVTPRSLPGLLLRGKPLAILLLPSDGLALLASLPPAPPHTTLAWLNQSRYQHILGKLGHVYGNRPPSLVVMDTSESQTNIRRCKPRGTGPLDVAGIKDCLAEVGGNWLSWEQPVQLASAEWPPKMEPLPFPSQNRMESVDPIPDDEQLPLPSHVHVHTEL